MPRRKDTFDRRSLAGSVAVHAVAVVAAVLSSTIRPEPLDFVTYEIELVSPAPPVRAPEPEVAAEELVVERPDPTPPPPPPVEETPAEVLPEPEPPPPPAPREETPPPPVEAEESTPAADPDAPAETERETGENINVRMEGLRRDYPRYYENIILQMQRCFRWQGQDDLATEIYFVIRRDGSVVDARVLESSGNALFDIEALGAAECAGRGRFGPLPEELPYDRFPIRFQFNPRGRDFVQPATADDAPRTTRTDTT